MVAIPHNTPINSVEDYARELLRSALWDVGYHERGLRKVKPILKTIEEMLQRSGFDLEKLKEIETDADELHEASFDNVEHLAAALLEERRNSVEHHEDGLRDGYRDLGLVKILLTRGEFDIDIAEIQKQVDEQLA